MDKIRLRITINYREWLLNVQYTKTVVINLGQTNWIDIY